MEVTTEHVRYYLEKPQRVLDFGSEYAEKVEALMLRATKTTAQLTGMPGGGSSDRDALLAKYVDAKAEYVSWKESATSYVLKEFDDFISQMPLSAIQQEILKARYHDMHPWKDVYNTIQQYKRISARHIFREHNLALQLCADKLNAEPTKYNKYIKEMQDL